VTVKSRSGEAVIPAIIDSSLAPGTVYVPFNFGLDLGADLGVEVVPVTGGEP